MSENKLKEIPDFDKVFETEGKHLSTSDGRSSYIAGYSDAIGYHCRPLHESLTLAIAALELIARADYVNYYQDGILINNDYDMAKKALESIRKLGVME